MDTLLRDIKYSFRRLQKSPGFTIIVVLTLALGIGANTAIFSVVNGVLLRPLPYREPGRLVTIEHFYPSLNDMRAPVSSHGFRDYRDQTKSFEAVAVETQWGVNLTGTGDPERVPGVKVSGDWFRALGVAPARGRGLQRDDDQPGHELGVLGRQHDADFPAQRMPIHHGRLANDARQERRGIANIVAQQVGPRYVTR